MRLLIAITVLGLSLSSGSARAQIPQVPPLVSVTGGSGAPPEISDIVTYRYRGWPGRDRDSTAEAHEYTIPLSDVPWPGVQDVHLPLMRPGERRLFRYFGNSGLDCDHFGCAPPSWWSIELELVAVMSRHDELPDGMHIGIRPLHVRRGGIRAVLAADSVTRVDRVRLDGSEVAIDTVAAEFSDLEHSVMYRFTLRQLRARLADAEAIDLIRRSRFTEAMTRAEQAIALDASIDSAYLSRAWVLLARGKLDAAAEALAPVIARNPVWLYWRLVSEPALARLLSHPAITKLVSPTAGSLDASSGQLVVQTEPTGSFLAYYSDGGSIAGRLAACGVIHVVDRATLAAVRIPASTCTQPDATLRAQRRAAERTMRAFGFTAASGEAATLDFTDDQMQWFPNQTARFDDAKLQLVASHAPADHEHLPIEVPGRARLDATLLVGDLAVFRWWPNAGVMIARRPPPGAVATPPPPPDASPLDTWPHEDPPAPAFVETPTAPSATPRTPILLLLVLALLVILDRALLRRSIEG